MPSYSEYKTALAVEHNRHLANKRDADLLVRKYKLRQEFATSDGVKRAHYYAGESVSDILERCHAMGFLTGDEERRSLQEITSLINRGLGDR
jgi:hypothetical protein